MKLLQQEDKRIRVGGFIEAVRAAVKSEGEWLAEPWLFKPDAWLINTDEGEITAFEVEDSHPMSMSKLEAYVSLDALLDWEGWMLRLVALDRYAQNRRELDLRAYLMLLDDDPPTEEETLNVIALMEADRNNK